VGTSVCAYMVRRLWYHDFGFGVAGANIGLFTLQLLLMAPAPAVIIAAEPLPQNAALLQQNLALHADAIADSGCDVRVLPLAIGDSSGSRTFTYFPHMPGNSTALPGEKAQLQATLMPAARFANQQTCSCRVISVSDLISQENLRRVDLLKVDAEGMELAVLRGIAPLDWPRVRQLVAEVHDVVEGSSGRLAQVLALLQSHSFECRVVPTAPEGNVLVYAMQRQAVEQLSPSSI
jgi:FkbM family methyltransferase